MAKNKVTGRTEPELEEMRAAFRERHEDDPTMWFEKSYCLAKIPHQPDHYDGPQRFCVSDNTRQLGANWLCKFHGGAGSINKDNLDKLASMTHGMRAMRKHLRQDFSDKDEALYEWVVESYPDAYDINIEESPADAYDIHRLAVEIVRAERGRGHVLREGEIHEEEKVGENGIVVDDRGEIVTEKSQHYLARMLKDQDSKITQLQRELGITRKERRKHDTETDAIDAMKGFQELGKEFIKRDEKDYSQDDQPWEDDVKDE